MNDDIEEFKICNGFSLDILENEINRNLREGFVFFNKMGIRKSNDEFYVEMVRYRRLETSFTGQDIINRLYIPNENEENDENDEVFSTEQLRRLGIS